MTGNFPTISFMLFFSYQPLWDTIDQNVKKILQSTCTQGQCTVPNFACVLIQRNTIGCLPLGPFNECQSVVITFLSAYDHAFKQKEKRFFKIGPKLCLCSIHPW